MKGNYLNKIERIAKRSLKGKIKITLALIVSLMITGRAYAGVGEVNLYLSDSPFSWSSSDDLESSTGYGVRVNGPYEIYGDLLAEKIELEIINNNNLAVTNEKEGGVSSGVYIPGTDKLFEFFPDETAYADGNSYFRVENNNKIDVTGKSAYGIHLEFMESAETIEAEITPEETEIDVLSSDSEEEEEDPLYAYPDIDIKNSGTINAAGDLEAEGVRIATPFSIVAIDNSGVIASVVGNSEAEETHYGGSMGINVFITPEVEEPENPVPDWIAEGSEEEEEELSVSPMNVSINNSGNIEASVANRDVAKIMGINVGEYDDHTLTVDTEIIGDVERGEPSVIESDPIIAEPYYIMAADIMETEIYSESTPEQTSEPAVTETSTLVASSASSGNGNGKHSGESETGSGTGTKPLEALVFNTITNEGSINIKGADVSAVQAVGISSRMAEGTQSTIDNKGDITVNVEMEDARQTNVEEDPTAGNLYGINVFNSGTPARINANNSGEIIVEGTITASSEDAVDPVGIQSFGIKSKSRGKNSVSDTNNTGEIYVSSTENQNSSDMDYSYYEDTEGKEIFGARAVGIYGTAAGRGAYTEITNGNYDISIDQETMDGIRAGEDLDLYDAITGEIKNQYDSKLDEFDTYKSDVEINAKITSEATSAYGYAEAKGVWSTAEAIENSQFVYNSEDSAIIAKATAANRGAEALGIESVSYQNTVINQGLIDVASDGKTATGIGILAEISEIEEDELNEHARKPEFIGADIGMPPDLPGNSDDKQGGDNSGGEESTVLMSIYSDAEPVVVVEETAAYSTDTTLYRTAVDLTDETVSSLVSLSDESESTEGSKNDTTGSENETGVPEIGERNKYILNTGTINVNVNENEEIDSSFAFGAGIASSRVVAERITGDRVDDFAIQDESTEITEVDAVAGASVSESSEASAEEGESQSQYITNNGSINVSVRGDTALASGITSLTKVEAIFDTDGDGVSDSADAAPFVSGYTSDLDGDGTADEVDPDADGDGFKSIAAGGTDYFDNDSDNDGLSNSEDNDDDGDGILDEEDPEITPISEDGISLSGSFGFLPLTEEQYEDFMDTSGGMPENLIETSGILEDEEVFITSSFTNNGDIKVKAVSEAEGGTAIANGISTDVVWSDLQKPVYEIPEGTVDTGETQLSGEVQANVIEKNYDSFINSEGALIESVAVAEKGTALAFGMRDGNYYTVDEAASERTSATKRYVGSLELSEDGTEYIPEFGMVNDGEISVTAIGQEAKAFGMMSGYLDTSDDVNEEFVVSNVKNTGSITVDYSDSSESSEGAGIVAFADQQIEYLPKVLEGGVLLPVVEEESDSTVEAPLVFEDYVVKEPEKAVVIVENTGTIRINGKTGDKNYGIYAGINFVDEEGIEEQELISVKEIVLSETTVTTEEITVETQNGNDGESETQNIGTLYTVTTADNDVYQFVMHAPDEKGETVPEKIYVVVDGDEAVGSATPYVEETYKLGETLIRVNNSGDIFADGGVGIYTSSSSIVENSGTIIASKAIVTSGGDDTVSLKSGSKISGDVYTGSGNDQLSIDKGSELNGNIYLGEGEDLLTLDREAVIGNEESSYVIDGGNGVDKIIMSGKDSENGNRINGDILNFESGEIEGKWEMDEISNLDFGTGTLTIGKDSSMKVKMKGNHDSIEGGNIKASKLVVDGKLIFDIGEVSKLGTGSFKYKPGDTMSISTSTGEDADILTSTYAWDAEIVDEVTETEELNSASEIMAFSALAVTADESSDTTSSSVVFRRTGFTSFASSENSDLAAVLDADYEANSDSDLSILYSNVENTLMSTDLDEVTAAENLNEALEDLEGSEYAAYPALTMSVSRAFNKNISSFMDSLDSGSSVDEKASRLSFNPDEKTRQYVTVFGDFGDYDGSDTEGFDYDTYGVVLATDRELMSGSRAGISYGYAATDVDYDDGGSGDIKTFHIGGYHRKEEGPWTIKSSLNFDYNQNDIERVVIVGTDKYEPSADFDSYVFSGGSEVSYDYGVEDWIIRPLAGLTYSRIQQDSFEEDTIVGVENGSEGFNSLVSEIGVKAIKEFYLPKNQLKLHFGLSWLHEFGDIYDSQNLALAGGSYSISGIDIEDDSYELGVGIEVDTNSKWSYNLKYSYEGASNYDGYRVSAGFKYEF